jgi:hypothetical protein
LNFLHLLLLHSSIYCPFRRETDTLINGTHFSQIFTLVYFSLKWTTNGGIVNRENPNFSCWHLQLPPI